MNNKNLITTKVILPKKSQAKKIMNWVLFGNETEQERINKINARWHAEKEDCGFDDVN